MFFKIAEAIVLYMQFSIDSRLYLSFKRENAYE